MNQGKVYDPEIDNRCKLTQREVDEIRASYIPWKVTYRELAERYGVSAPQIYYIVNNQAWKVNNGD